MNFDSPQSPPREFVLHNRTFQARHKPTVDQQLRFLTVMHAIDPEDDMVKAIQATQQFVLDMLIDDAQRNELDLMFSSEVTMDELHRLFEWLAATEDADSQS